MRLRNPCVFFLRRTLGWNVRFIDPLVPFLAPSASAEPGQCRHRPEASQPDDLPCGALRHRATLRPRYSTSCLMSSPKAPSPVIHRLWITVCVSGGSAYAHRPLGSTLGRRFPPDSRRRRRLLVPPVPPARVRRRPPENRRTQ